MQKIHEIYSKQANTINKDMTDLYKEINKKIAEKKKLTTEHYQNLCDEYLQNIDNIDDFFIFMRLWLDICENICECKYEYEDKCGCKVGYDINRCTYCNKINGKIYMNYPKGYITIDNSIYTGSYSNEIYNINEKPEDKHFDYEMINEFNEFLKNDEKKIFIYYAFLYGYFDSYLLDYLNNKKLKNGLTIHIEYFVGSYEDDDSTVCIILILE